MKKINAHIIAFFLICFTACDFKHQNNPDKNLVAEAFGHKLYASEIEPYLESIHNKSDSQYTVSQYVDDWLMDIILIEEAKNKVKDRTNINSLVKGYEESLIIQELENTYIKNRLDTFISKEEIDSFFNFHNEDFVLQETIVRILYIKIADSYNNDTLRNFWKTEDLPALNQFVSKSSGLALLDANEWYYLSSLRNIVPTKLYAKISLKKPNSYTHKENDQHFYLKLLEIIADNDDAPVSFVKERIKLRIIQDRIRSLLKRTKAALFDSKIKSKRIKIYGKENI